MKKSIVLGILGLTTAAVSGYGQGAIFLDNYSSEANNDIYESAALGGARVPAGFTVGLYYDSTANQNITGSIAADPTGFADPSTLNAALVVATGTGSTAPILSYAPGEFEASASFLIQPDAATPAQSSYTIMVVAYNGSSYDASTIRGHSAAIYIQDVSPAVTGGGDIGTYFPLNTPMFSVYSVPEPGTLALAGLGGLSLWLMRRKKT